MRFRSQKYSTAFRAIMVASTAAFIVSAPAFAGQRNPAPIQYAGQTPSGSRTVAARPVAAVRSSAPAPGEEGNRIAFRYPGQSGSPAVADRTYASVSAPQMSAPTQMTDSPVTTREFDARETANRITAARESEVVESAPLAALESQDEPAGKGAYVEQVAPAAVVPQAFSVAQGQTPVFDEVGIGITYGDEFSGLPTANGEMFSQAEFTAAHPTLPLPSLVQVTNLDTNQEVVVRVNDRGPFEDGAMLQLSEKAANSLQFGAEGRGRVRMRYLGPAPVSGATTAFQQTQAVSDAVAPATYVIGKGEREQQPIYVAANSYDLPLATSSSQTGQGDYFVQVGSFADIGNAQAFKESLGTSLPILIVPARVNGSDYFRVRVGPLDSHQRASAVRDDLADRGVANGRIVGKD